LKYFSKAYVPTVPVNFSQKAYETIISIFICILFVAYMIEERVKIFCKLLQNA